MVNLKNIYDSIVDFSKAYSPNSADIKIFVPSRSEYGNISTNIAMILARNSKEVVVDEAADGDILADEAESRDILPMERKNLTPKDAFEVIRSGLEGIEYVEKVEFVAGFCNLTLNRAFFEAGLREVLSMKKLFGSQQMKNKIRVNLEYVSANPTGYMHLGHTRSIYADAIANLLEFCGYDVTREYYLNDAGNQIQIFAKSIFYEYAKLSGMEFEKPEEMYPGEHIAVIAGRIYDENPDFSWEQDSEVFTEKVLMHIVGFIKEDLKFLDIEHDVWTSEQHIQKSRFVNEAIDILERNGMVFEGALGEIISGKGKKSINPIKIFRFPGGEKALTKSDGSFTYFAADIGYHYYKIKRGFDWIIDFFGADHGGQIAPLEHAVEALGAKKFQIVLFQSVAYISNQSRQKFSKRSGVTVRPIDLEIDSADLLRFLMTSKNIDTHCNINLDDVSKISESGFYYIQYAYTRCSSILRSAKEEWDDFEENSLVDYINFDFYDSSTIDILDLILQWPLEVELCRKSLSINSIPSYMQKLAAKFHSMWTVGKGDPEKRFIVKTDQKLSYSRLCIIYAILITLSAGFKILGIKGLEEIHRG